MAIEGFAYARTQEIVLRDLDSFGHVNNSVFLTYVENARVGYLATVVGARRREEIRNIMARAEIDFHAELSFGDDLELGVRCEHLGTKSFELRYRLVRGDGVIAADVRSTHVMFDFDKSASVPLPDEWRRAIEAWEKGSL